MTNRDLAVGAVGVIQPSGAIATGGIVAGSAISRKPAFLITLDEVPGTTKKNVKRFISTEKPDLLNGFIQVKGIFSDSTEEEISETFSELLTTSPKDLFIEVLFPWHRICSIRSLVFRAK